MQFFTINSQAKVNPATGEGSPYFHGTEEGQVMYVVQTGKSFKAVSSHGASAEDADPIGKNVAMTVQSHVSHDRTTYGNVVVGFVDERGEKFGNVPNRKVPHYVMK